MSASVPLLIQGKKNGEKMTDGWPTDNWAATPERRRQKEQGVNTGVFLSKDDYELMLRLQAKYILEQERRISISETIRLALRKTASFEGIAA